MESMIGYASPTARSVGQFWFSSTTRMFGFFGNFRRRCAPGIRCVSYPPLQAVEGARVAFRDRP